MIIKFDGSIYEKWTAWEFIKVTQNFVNMNSLFSHTVREEGYWGKRGSIAYGGAIQKISKLKWFGLRILKKSNKVFRLKILPMALSWIGLPTSSPSGFSISRSFGLGRRNLNRRT